MDAPKYKVLVVDDEANQRSALGKHDCGVGISKPAAAAEGAAALEVLKEFEASAIVTDLMMPGMDGSTLLKKPKRAG